MDAFRERRIRLRTGAVVGALECGEPGSAPPLVLVPGVGGAKELFAGALTRFARGRQALAVDLSPRGRRGVPPATSAAQDLWEVVDAAGLGAVDLLGQSFGAVVAVRAWRSRPHAVRRVVLAPPGMAPAPALAPRALLVAFLLGGTVRMWPNARLASLGSFLRRAGGYAIEPELQGDELAALVSRVKRIPVLPFTRRLTSMARHSWRKELEDLTAPLLVIEGEREAAILPAGMLDFFRSRAATRTVVVPGGHMPFLTHPQEFVGTVLEFLDQPDRESETRAAASYS